MENTECKVLEQRLNFFVDKDNALRDIVGYLDTNYSAGDKIPSERDLEINVGYSRAKTREALIRLECFGYIEIHHGKASILLKPISM